MTTPTIPQFTRSTQSTPSTHAAGQLAELANRFRQQTAPTVGTEIELYIVDSRTGQPCPLFDEIHQLLPPDIQQQTEGEFLACQIEFATTPCHTIEEVQHQLQQFVEAATIAARSFNAELLWSGTHPTWQFEQTMIRDCERSWHNCRRFGALTHQLCTCGLHVHVAVPHDRAAYNPDATAEHKWWSLPVIRLPNFHCSEYHQSLDVVAPKCF